MPWRSSPWRFHTASSASVRAQEYPYDRHFPAGSEGSLCAHHRRAWQNHFLDCLDRALAATDETLAMVLKKAKFWERNTNVSFNHRQKLLLNKLLDGFDGKLTSSKWAKIAKCSSDTAVRDINDLVQKNILVKERAGGRSTSYILYTDLGVN